MENEKGATNRLLPVVDKNEVRINDVQKLISDVDTLIESRNFKQIDSLIETIMFVIENEPVEMIVALLQVTQSVRNYLSKWYSLRNSAQFELNRRNLDAEQILKGII